MTQCLEATHSAEALTLTWDDGRSTALPAPFLRAEARDAWTRREMIDHGAVRIAPGLEITALVHMGYGVNVHFSDGHDKAIYPFPFLRELSERFDK